jgi:dUTP pyrophosphatase
MIELGIVNKSENSLPKYETLGSSGMDIMAAFLPDYGILLQPGERTLIHTGLYFEIPDDYEIQVRSRSGLTLKKGLIVLNEPGTIDADYRGELGVILYNASDREQLIENGDRIAQIVLMKVEKIKFNVKKEIEKNTDRGSGGFGHTGEKRRN